MNIEENRLRSFHGWPSHMPVMELAHNGFYSKMSTSGFYVECNWCHSDMDCHNIRSTEVEEIHRLLDPHCDFLCNYESCNNVSIEGAAGQSRSNSNCSNTVTSEQYSDTAQRPDLLIEANRLATFTNWPNPNISPESLAKAGFFYLNRSDEVKCAWCKGVIARWEKQDNAFQEHKRFFPNCPRVQLGPLIEMTNDGIRDLGIQQISPPKMPKFSSLDTRLRTYTNWPIRDVQKPESLAQAGLYYQNVDDQVRCFHCNIGLRSWQKEDDPWFEHAKWYPQCQFVKLVKGVNYVQSVQNITKQTSQLQHQASSSVMSIDEAMKTSPVLQALQMGIDIVSIRNATQKHLTLTGRPFDLVEDLVKVIFDERKYEDSSEHDENEGAGASIVKEVSRIINSIFGDVDNSGASSSAETNICQLPMSSGTTTANANIISNVSSADTSNDVKTEDTSNNDCKNNIATVSDTVTCNSMSLEEENRKLKDARLCKVCLDDEVGVVFLPCGHLVTCVQCAPSVNHCPMCRTEIKGFVRTFLSFNCDQWANDSINCPIYIEDIMESEDCTCTALSIENGKLGHFSENVAPGFSRNRSTYSSLPIHINHRRKDIDVETSKEYRETQKQKHSLNEELSLHDYLVDLNNDHTFGLSTSLSTESLKNACSYSDEESDKNFNISQNISPKTLTHESHTQLCFSNDTETQEHEIFPVNFVEHQDKTETTSTILDCLLDLDNYLDELDNESLVNFDNENFQAKSSVLQRLNSRRSTLPLKWKKDLYVDEKNKESNSRFSRLNKLRKTLSCNIGTNESGYSLFSNSSVAAHSDLEIFIDKSSQSDCNSHSSTTFNDNESQKVKNNMSYYNNRADLKDLKVNLTAKNDLRRCFSQNCLQDNTLYINPNEMLTEDNIFQNLLAQQERSSTFENRPRQIGRRGEGQPCILPMRSDSLDNINMTTYISCNQRPLSAPTPSNVSNFSENTQIYNVDNAGVFVGSDESSLPSTSHNESHVSLASSSDCSFIEVSANPDIVGNLAINESIGSGTAETQTENHSTLPGDCNNEWPHGVSRALALTSCTLGLFNICRFAGLTINYGGNFLIQFFLLSIIFGIPLLWLQMCLGSKIRCGPISMWKISPICKGIGVTVVLIQCVIAIYSSVVIAWTLVYVRDSFLGNENSSYPWENAININRNKLSVSNNLTESVADYFNIIVLGRFKHFRDLDSTDTKFHLNDRLVTFLTLLWIAVILVLCKGFKSLGYAIFGLILVPFLGLIVLTCKIIFLINPSKIQNILSLNDLDDFLVNSKAWTAAAQEVFLTWGLFGASVIAFSSRNNKNNTKTSLRTDAIVTVLLTLLGLSIAALLGLCTIQVLNQYSYVYVPGSFEHPEIYTAVYSIDVNLNTNVLSYPSKWIPHCSGFIGEAYRKITIGQRESGYQVLRFITELFPAVVALKKATMFWFWSFAAFTTFFLFGLVQLCAVWKPISLALGNTTTSVILSCIVGLLLTLPFTSEFGIHALYYFDLLLGGSWILPILWAIEIFGVFLIRGRPYNGDDLVNDLKMSQSVSAFLALSWNVLLPIGLIALSVIDYKVSMSNEFYYWRGKSYFSFWVRKVGSLVQVGLLLLTPLIAICQICRYLTKGPPDILDRIQLLYRPDENLTHRRFVSSNSGHVENGCYNTRTNVDLSVNRIQDDAPPKYTPPPSYTTATGARLAKYLRRSIRRSVRR
ncbi:uncharacterized protein LOC119683913 [Teleopsis dalmanni]|uniref:uncharacterized protein LOC119683913 n=1 Tax=Teleopsis dalmanni TaxID=139649 RepID=UPI0018CCA5BA|nr:uncharacterized protein LOC119683913 [Teleopsis dalmanni]